MSTKEKMLLPLHCDLAAEALEGASFQCKSAARFLTRGDIVAADEAYRRVVALFREYIAPEMKIVAASIDTLTAEAAAEWREDRDKSSKPKTARAA